MSLYDRMTQAPVKPAIPARPELSSFTWQQRQEVTGVTAHLVSDQSPRALCGLRKDTGRQWAPVTGTPQCAVCTQRRAAIARRGFRK